MLYGKMSLLLLTNAKAHQCITTVLSAHPFQGQSASNPPDPWI